LISLQQVTKEFGRKTAVNKLNLEIAPGEFFAFIGPNGAGKTTTIKMAVGLLKPTSGRVLISGVDIHEDYIAAKKKLGYVPDQPYLYDKLSGREFMKFVGGMYGMERTAIDKEIARLSEMFGMNSYVDELTETYSHGMKQRVVLSATLLHAPDVIVVDEPLVGLDPQTSRLVKEILKGETRKGRTVFMSTHVLSIAEETADRIGIISHGDVVAIGSVQELLAQNKGAAKLEDVFFSILGTECEVPRGVSHEPTGK
jgi:ABC-2 type transport system ATP-binding protein